MAEFLRHFGKRVYYEGHPDAAKQILDLADKLEKQGLPREFNVRPESPLQRVSRLISPVAMNLPNEAPLSKLHSWETIEDSDPPYLVEWRETMQMFDGAEKRQMSNSLGPLIRRLKAKTLGDLVGMTPEGLWKVRGIGFEIADFIFYTFDLASRTSDKGE